MLGEIDNSIYLLESLKNTLPGNRDLSGVGYAAYERPYQEISEAKPGIGVLTELSDLTDDHVGDWTSKPA
jgi:hypothetical protein